LINYITFDKRKTIKAMEGIQRVLKRVTLIVTPHDQSKANVIDIEKLKQKERDLGYLPILLEDCINHNDGITAEEIATTVPFLCGWVDRVVVNWLTECEIYNAVVEHCEQTEKECERV